MNNGFVLIHHEADPYKKPWHSHRHETRSVAAIADVNFVVGTGDFSRIGSRRIPNNTRWTPSTFDPGRFGRERPQWQKPQHLATVIANRNTPRVPLRGLPGWRDRIAAVEQVQRDLGSSVRIYGSGWSGEGTAGPLPYSHQERALAKSWTLFNWDHFPQEPSYFSDRIPIALASGSIIFTTDHAGYESIFPGETARFLKRLRTWKYAGSAIKDYVKNIGSDEHSASRHLAWAFAHQHFRQDDNLVEMLNFDRIVIEPEAARRAWNMETDPLERE